MSESPDMSNKSIYLRQSLLLYCAAVFGVVMLGPYLMVVQGEVLEQAVAQSGMSLATLLLISLGQQLVILLAMVMGGVKLAQRAGLRAPVSEALARGEREQAWREVQRWGVRAALVGLVLGAVTLGVRAGFDPHLPEALKQTEQGLTWWRGLLASFYGGITEEVFLRLFLMSALAAGMKAAVARREAQAPEWVYWVANGVAALCFGALHLPTVAATMPLTAPLVAYALIGNGLLGVAFGWLYRRHGIEAAMVSHFSADLVLHVFAAL